MNWDEPILRKLVRDLMFLIRQVAGWKCEYTILEHQADIDFHLGKKVEEELYELYSTSTRTQELEEIADLWALRDAIIKHRAKIPDHLQVKLDDVLDRYLGSFEYLVKPVREEKKKKKGEFNNLVFIISETRA